MKNKITVQIAHREYKLVATEDETYIESIATMVDAEMKKMLSGTGLSAVDAAVMAAVNIADQLLKEKATSENLRHQIKDRYEEAAALQLEVSTLKQENFKLSSGAKTGGKK